MSDERQETDPGTKLTRANATAADGYVTPNALINQRRYYGEVPYLMAPPSPPVRSLATAGLAVGAIFFLGFGSWATLMPLASAAHAPAQFAVESNRQEINHQEGGIIKQILVRDGQSVTQGEVLIRLEPLQGERQTVAFSSGAGCGTRQ